MYNVKTHQLVCTKFDFRFRNRKRQTILRHRIRYSAGDCGDCCQFGKEFSLAAPDISSSGLNNMLNYVIKKLKLFCEI